MMKSGDAAGFIFGEVVLAAGHRGAGWAEGF